MLKLSHKKCTEMHVGRNVTVLLATLYYVENRLRMVLCSYYQLNCNATTLLNLVRGRALLFALLYSVNMSKFGYI